MKVVLCLGLYGENQERLESYFRHTTDSLTFACSGEGTPTPSTSIFSYGR
jgi:hypothetical protein